MRKLVTIVLVSVALAAGCGDKKGEGGGGGKESVKWPEKPANGAPVAVEFVKMTGKGEDLEAEMRFFNFADKPVRRIYLDLHYLGEDGKPLREPFPFTLQAPTLVEAKGTRTKDVGAFVPEATKKVQGEVREVEFADGTKWP